MNQWQRRPWWSMIIAVPAVLVIAITGCGSDESSTTTTKTKKKQDSARKAGTESNLDRVASSYAREVSGGKWEYGGLSAAAYSGCLEALLGRHVGSPGVSYKDEFPEPELQVIYEKALRDCS
jgi:hypothetical protein